MRARLVVGVDQSGLEVAVAHPLLERAEGDASRGHPRPERVAEVMEADIAEAGALGGALEPLEQPGAIERLAALGMAEDKVAVPLVGAPAEVVLEFGGDPVGQRD